MRVLFVIESLGVGGAEILLKNLCCSLGRLGVECEVAYLFKPADLSAELERRQVPVHYLEATRRGFLATGQKIARLVAQRRIDVVHAHLFHAALAVAVSRCLGRRGPGLLTFHNEGYDSYPPETLTRRIRRYLDGLITRTLFDRWLANSAASADSARRHLALTSVDVVANGIDLALVNEASRVPLAGCRESHGLPKEARLVVLPGRLVWEKGHDLLCEAWPKVLQHCPDACCVMVGDGPLRGEIAASIKERGIDGSIRLIPRLPQPELYRLLRTAELVVIPSRREGWSLLVAEAMALGLPIVCSSAGGIAEALGDASNAIVFPAGDASLLAEALVSLLADQAKQRELSARGRERAFGELSIEAAARRHLEIYRELLQRFQPA
jgi:glycosyltransferase involved in cell wall biosynthesis